MSVDKSNESLIYMAQSKLNRKEIYIGKTHQDIEKRKEQHEEAALKRDGTKFHDALLNVGFANWDWQVIAKCPIDEEYEIEQEYIAKFNAEGVDLLNTTHNKQKKVSTKPQSKLVIKNLANNKTPGPVKSDMGKLFLREAGKIKPVINLTTKKVFESVTEAAELENLPRSTIKLSCETGKMLKDRTRYSYLDLSDQPVLFEGHHQEIYIGSKTKKVKNLTTGKVFDSLSEAAETYDLSLSALQGNASGEYMTLKNKWVFCYLDANGSELRTERHEKGLEKLKSIDVTKYIAWHIDDLTCKEPRYFKSLDEICDKLNLHSKSHIKGVCDGARSHTEKWRIAYFDNEKQEPILTKRHNEKAKKIIRKIICLDDKKIFKNASEAGSSYHVIANQIGLCAKGILKSVTSKGQKLRFAYLDDNNEPILTDMHHEPLGWRGKHRVLHIETGKKYNSLKAFCDETGVSQKRAKRYIEDKTIDLLGHEFIILE